jgi:hypothetical protein
MRALKRWLVVYRTSYVCSELDPTALSRDAVLLKRNRRYGF